MNPLWISKEKAKTKKHRTHRQRLQIVFAFVCVCLLKTEVFLHYGGSCFERKRRPVVLPFQLKRVKHNKGKTMDRAIDDFKKKLNKSGLKETSSHDGCHFFLFFCPIISRAGTDIDNALKYLDQVKAPKRVIMVVLHPTINPEKTILDSNSAITREDIFAMDCLVSDNELLTCEKNTNAINKIAQDLKSKKQNAYYCLKNQKTENHPLMSNESSKHQPNIRDDVHSEECGCIQLFLDCIQRLK